jgi:3-oxoacyl-[acyl-carrier-protein] synthase-3
MVILLVLQSVNPLSQLKNELERKTKYGHIACGFGWSLSWGSVYFETEKIVCSELIEY